MRASVLGRRCRSATVGEQDRRLRVGEHEGEPLLRIVRVERQVGGAGLEDAEERDHHVERALDAEPDDGLGSGAERAQMVRELVGADVELAVAQRLGRRTRARWRRACGRPARRTAPGWWRPGPAARCRSTR